MRSRILLALGVLLAALAVSAVAPAAAQACASSPLRTVQRFYSAIDDDRFRTAWNCLSPATREGFGGYARWRDGYRMTVSTRLTASSVENGTSTLATIAFRLRSCRLGDRSDVVERFAGTWDVRLTGGAWRMGSPDVRRTARSAVRAC